MVTLELEARLDNLLATAQTETANIDLLAPLPEREECPICLVPLPINDDDTTFHSCCGKYVCSWCIYKSVLKDIENGVQQDEIKCAFCRQLTPKNGVKALKKLMKKNEPGAFVHMASRYQSGDGVMQSDTKTLEMYIRAAELGFPNAYTDIGYHYRRGIVVEQDGSKSLAFYEVAAKKGSMYAHKILAKFHGNNGNNQKCIEHLKVAASAGDKESRIF